MKVDIFGHNGNREMIVAPNRKRDVSCRLWKAKTMPITAPIAGSERKMNPRIPLSIDIALRLSKGNENTEVLWPIDDPPPLTSTDFILLKSGDSLGTKLKMSVKQFVKSPGEYELFVEYRSYLSEDLARKYIPQHDVPFWSRERNTVTSNKIKLRITE